MSNIADQVLSDSHIGSAVTYGSQVIARITQKNESKFEVRDIHGKYWLIDREQVRNLEYSIFVRDLASAIARSCPDKVSEVSARRVLAKLIVGDELCDNSTCLATLCEIDPDTNHGTSLTFEDVNGNRQQVFLDLIPKDLTFREYLYQFRQSIEIESGSITEPILLRYFKYEFIPKMLAQMVYDNERWGDTWLMKHRDGQEKTIHESFEKYFEYFDEFGKTIPWLKVVGHAVIAQAREDHPEWLL